MIHMDFEKNIIEYKIPNNKQEYECFKSEVYYILGAFLHINEQLGGEAINPKNLGTMMEMSKIFVSAYGGKK